jgi:ABC-2 type transport system permease protein
MTAALEPAPIPTSVAARLRWTIVDGWSLMRRELWHLKSDPTQIAAPLIISVVFVLLFGYVFGSAIVVPGGGDYREYLMPGLLTLASGTPAMVSAMSIARERARGVMDRFRSMPMARLAVPFGQTASDLMTGPVSLLVMALTGLAVGWRVHRGFVPAVEAFALLMLFRYAMSWVGVFVGLSVRSEVLDTLGSLFFPIIMISNAFVPTNHMPVWLRVIADWNPVSAVSEVCRDLFGNPGAASTGPWPIQHPELATVAWSVGLIVIFAALAVRRFITSED